MSQGTGWGNSYSQHTSRNRKGKRNVQLKFTFSILIAGLFNNKFTKIKQLSHKLYFWVIVQITKQTLRLYTKCIKRGNTKLPSPNSTTDPTVWSSCSIMWLTFDKLDTRASIKTFYVYLSYKQARYIIIDLMQNLFSLFVLYCTTHTMYRKNTWTQINKQKSKM